MQARTGRLDECLQLKRPLDLSADGAEPPPSSGGVRHRLSEGRRLVGIAYRDPEHVAARLTLYGSERLGEPSLEWASRVQQRAPGRRRAR